MAHWEQIKTYLASYIAPEILSTPAQVAYTAHLVLVGDSLSLLPMIVAYV